MTQSSLPEPKRFPNVTWAQNYAKQFGWHVFPLHSIDSKTGHCTCKRAECIGSNNEGKHPRTRNGVLDATTDPEIIGKWWSKHPDSNIGVACGPSKLVVIDIDPRNDGDNTLVALEKTNGKLPSTPCALTGGGGQHYLFRMPSESMRGSKIPDGIDVKADGGYIVAAPSNHLSGRRYEWDAGAHPKDVALAELPVWIIGLLRKKTDAKQSEIKPEDGYLGAAFKAAGWAGQSIGSDKIAVQCPWESEHSSGSRFDSSTVIYSPNSGCNTGAFWCAHSHCQNSRTLKDVLRKLPASAHASARKHLGLPEKHSPPPESSPSEIDTNEPWTQMLRFNGEGQMRKDPGNAALLLANLPEWKGAIRYDEFSGKTRWARPAPLIDGMARPVVGEELKDTHVIYVGHWLSRFSRVTFTRETVRDAIESAALSHRYNPLQEYLESLAWDRKPRVGVWLSTYLGCEDSEYTRIVGRWWLISAVARAMKPGCQADCVLVLKGPQGARKSSAVIALAGDQWVLESLPKLNDKDSVQILRGVWIAAMNELESIRGTALTRVKDYISTRVDKFRASYGRYTIDVPRACVFVGTANEQYCLPYDPTGLRRWWPVDVGAIDTDAIERDRDQIWAEAMAYYRAGEHWWPESMGHLDLLHEQQQSSVDSDPWESVIGDWLAHREEILEPGDTLHVTTTHVLQSCLGVTPDRMTRADQTRAGGILRGLGYESQRVRTGSGNREYQYSRVSG